MAAQRLPPEPVLAEAVAHYLNGVGDIGVSGPTILAEACERGFLAQGEGGELCRGLLATIAHDMAVRNYYGKIKSRSKVYWHRPVPGLCCMGLPFKPKTPRSQLAGPFLFTGATWVLLSRLRRRL